MQVFNQKPKDLASLNFDLMIALEEELKDHQRDYNSSFRDHECLYKILLQLLEICSGISVCNIVVDRRTKEIYSVVVVVVFHKTILTKVWERSRLFFF